MKKSVFLTIILIPFLLSACNLPSYSAAPTTDNVATMVVQTLTHQPSTDPATVLQPTATSTVEIPVTPSSTYTATPTETPSETATITITPTPTTNPNDPKAGLGEPSWKTTFENSNSFGLQTAYQDDYTRIAISNGVMTLSNTSYLGYFGWRLTSPVSGNFYMEAPIKTNNCSGSDEFGLIVRAPDYSSGYGYYFTLNCNGQYNLYRWDDSGINPLLGWGTDASILTGSGQTNVMGVWASSSTIKLFINQKLLIELTDSRFGSGYFGAFIRGYSGNLSVSMEEISLWNLP